MWGGKINIYNLQHEKKEQKAFYKKINRKLIYDKIVTRNLSHIFCSTFQSCKLYNEMYLEDWKTHIMNDPI